MALEGPQLAYTRTDEDDECESTLQRALRLAREIEELLENAPPTQAPTSHPTSRSREPAHSTRMARAMAASLIDELEVLDRGPRQSGVA